jgi:hypothetical protein
MNMFCLSTYINKYLKSREENLEKIVMHKIKRFGDFYFLTQTQTKPKLITQAQTQTQYPNPNSLNQTQTPKRFGYEFGFGSCLPIIYLMSKVFDILQDTSPLL